MNGLRRTFEAASADAGYAALCRALRGLGALAATLRPMGLRAVIPADVAAALERTRRESVEHRARLAAAIARGHAIAG